MNSTDQEVVAEVREAYKFMMFCMSVPAAHMKGLHRNENPEMRI